MTTRDSSQSIPPSYRNPVIHDRGPSSYPGAYRITDAALKTYGITREFFGTTQVTNAGGSKFRVKDYQYLLGDGTVGMTFLPISDTGVSTCPDGTVVYGSTLVDALLRTEMNLGAQDPIYALAYYIHPELNHGTVPDFAKTDKIELGITHVGAYLGNGRTSNAPELYHNRRWSVSDDTGNDFGYPANLVIIGLQGTDQAVLNRNLNIVDDILNCGVRFPMEYKDSQFRMAELNTALMFYRDWVLQAHYLRTDKSWFTYCAAHKTLVTTIALNLPHNLDAFKEVYGAADGAEFFAQFCQYHMEIFGVPFSPDLQTRFVPLWKQQGLTRAQIRPFTIAEYSAWDAARLAGKLGSYGGFKPLPSGVGMPWGPQMTADLVNDFVQTYADFIDAGAIAFSATVFGLAAPVCTRAKIPLWQYLLEALPMVQQAMRAHASVFAPSIPGSICTDSAYYKGVFAALFTALGGKPGAEAALDAQSGGLWDKILSTIKGTVEPEVLTWAALELVRRDWNAIMNAGQLPLDTGYDNFMAAIQAEFQQARDLLVSDPSGIQFNAPPAIVHMIVTGMYRASPQVSVRTIATVMNYTEIEKNPT